MPKLFCCKVSHNPYKEEFVTEIPEKVFQMFNLKTKVK